MIWWRILTRFNLDVNLVFNIFLFLVNKIRLYMLQIVCKSMQVLVSEFQSRNNGFQMGSLHFSNENIIF